MSNITLLEDMTFARSLESDKVGDALHLDEASVYVRADYVIVSPGDANDPRAKQVRRLKGQAAVEVDSRLGKPVEGVFVRAAETQNTGGGIFCDIFLLDRSDVLVISEYAVGTYASVEAWLDSSTDGWYDGADW